MRIISITFALILELLLSAPRAEAAKTLFEFSPAAHCYITGTAGDAAGNVYVCGQTAKPTTLPGPVLRLGPTNGGTSDAFVFKLNPHGKPIATA